jgi:hypothetical protein
MVIIAGWAVVSSAEVKKEICNMEYGVAVSLREVFKTGFPIKSGMTTPSPDNGVQALPYWAMFSLARP